MITRSQQLLALKIWKQRYEQQGEFQVMDSIGGDSEAPEADQGDFVISFMLSFLLLM